MEKYFGNPYRGDPGVPHNDPGRFVSIWIGSAAFSVISWFHPYFWQLSNSYNWHDRAMLHEQYHWKRAMKKGQPYSFQIDRLMVATKPPPVFPPKSRVNIPLPTMAEDRSREFSLL